MNSAVIQISNLNENLSQRAWVSYIQSVKKLLVLWRPDKIYFEGVSLPDAPLQQACWVVECDGPVWNVGLKSELAVLAKEYKQPTVVFTAGETEFVTPEYKIPK